MRVFIYSSALLSGTQNFFSVYNEMKSHNSRKEIMLIYLDLDLSSFSDDTGTKENDSDITVLLSEGTLIISIQDNTVQKFQ